MSKSQKSFRFIVVSIAIVAVSTLAIAANWGSGFGFSLFAHAEGVVASESSTAPAPEPPMAGDVTVAVIPSCTPPPANMISWWPGENNANDIFVTNNGSFAPGTYAAGKVGQAFNLDGIDDFASFGNGATLQIPDTLTVDAWISPDATANGILKTIVSKFNQTSSAWAFFLTQTSPTTARVDGYITKVGGALVNVGGGVIPVGTGEYSHVAMSYSSADGLRVYVNGVQVGATGVGSGPIQTSPAEVRIGQDAQAISDRWFKGRVDEVEIFNRVLSAAEITNIYNAGSFGKCKTGLPGADDDNDGVINMNDACPGTPAGTTVNAAGCPVGQCFAPPANMVAWYPGAGNANDIQGPTFENGTLVNGATFAAGKVGQAFDFNGSNSVSIGSPAALKLSNSVTVDAWVSPTALPASGALMGVATKWAQNFGLGANSDSFALWLQNNGGTLQIFSGIHLASGAEPILTGGVVPLNTYTHVAMTYDNTTGSFVIYVNGLAVNSTTVTPQGIIGTDANIAIGREQSGQSRFFTGQIDEVEIFSRALLASEINAIYLADSAGKCKPTITTASPITRQQGSAAINGQIATVSDPNQAANTLTVTAIPLTGSGVTISNISVDVSGNVTANVEAGCTATNSTFTLTVTNNASVTATGTLTVNVTANTSPTLSYNNPAAIVFGSGTTVNPVTGPSDNGSVATIVVQSPGTYTGTISVNNGTGVVSISNAKPVGTHTITIRATDNCGATTDSTFTLTVNKANTGTVVISSLPSSTYGQSVTFTTTVTAAAPGAGMPTGTVNFLYGATPIAGCQNVPLTGASSAQCITSSIPAGSYTINVNYSGDGNFNTSTGSTAQTVNKANTTTALASSVNPTVFGQSVTFTATISVTSPGAGTPVGTVSFRDNGVNIGSCAAQAVAANVATCAISSLSVGSHPITAVYNGDANFNASPPSNTVNQVVNKADTNTSVSTTVGSSSSVAFGSGVGVTPPPGGTIPDPKVEVSLDGGSTWTPAFAADFVPYFAGTRWAIPSANINQGYGDPQNIDYRITFNLPNGAAGATLSGMVISDDQSVSVALNGTQIANYPYQGYVGESSPHPFSTNNPALFVTGNNVLQLRTLNLGGQTGIDFTGGVAYASVFGQPVTLTATVAAAAPGAGAPTGNVTFKDGGVTIGTCSSQPVSSNTATCSISTLSVGTHPITAVYNGDGNFNASPSSNTVNQIVNKADTTTALASSVNPTVWGQSVTFTATISVTSPGAGTPTGNVSFRDNGVNIGSCAAQAVAANVATCAISTLSVGSHPITAVYNGDANFNASPASNTVNQVVNKTDTTTSMASSLNPSIFGQSVTFTATISVTSPGAGTPTGTVSFTYDGNSICPNTPVAGGTAQCVMASLTAGTHVIAASYSGDANFNPSAGSVTPPQVVNKANTTTTITNSLTTPTTVGQAYAVNWSVTVNNPGAGTPTGTVTVSDGTGATCTAAVAAGTCMLTSLTPGNKTITATYNGDANFNGSTSTGVPHTVNISISGNISQFVQGGPNTPLAGVLVTLTGTNGGTTTTDANGNYSFAGIYSGNYTIMPSMAGKSFEPSSRTYANVTNNITGADFVAYNLPGGVPRDLRVVNTYVTPGQAAAVPVVLTALGNEAAITFSLNYDTNVTSIPAVTCGTSAPGCTVTTDTSVTGRIGITIVPATPLAAGQREIAKVTFPTLATNASNTPVTFGDSPRARSIRDASNNPLSSTYTNGFIVFTQGLEGDVAPRPTGDGQMQANDVTVERLFVVGSLIPDPSYNEFQRADTSPGSTSGDGQLDATDIVQTRRYVAGLDTSVGAAGPGTPPQTPISRPVSAGSRTMRVVSATAGAGDRVTVPVEMDIQGNEVAASFSLSFDPAKLRNPRIALGAGAFGDTTLTVNTQDAASGRITVLVDADSPLSKELVNITFDVARSAASGDTRVGFAEGPALSSISDANGQRLAAAYTDGTVTISGSNSAGVEVSGRVLTPDGRGLRNARVTLIDQNGMARTVATSAFGYYTFDGVAPGGTYSIGVASRQYRFAARTVRVTYNLSDVDFVGQE